MNRGQVYITTKRVLHWMLMVLLAFLLLKALIGKPTQVFPTTKYKDIVNRIHTKERQINNYSTVAFNEKALALRMERKFDSLRLQLDKVKRDRDTFQIVQIQDTIINILYTENNHLKNALVSQDSIILAQRYIIDAKDTIITTQKLDVRRLKRQRNISVLLNALLGGLLIIK